MQEDLKSNSFTHLLDGLESEENRMAFDDELLLIQRLKYFFFYRPREEFKLKQAKTGGAPYVHQRYTKKTSPKATKENQKPRNAKDIQQIKHPTYS